jgi:hypothetical protein
MLVAALLLATVIVRSRSAVQQIPIGKMLRVGLAAGLLVWAAVAAGSFLEVDPTDSSAVGQALDSPGEQTDTGGSAFSNVNPLLFPLAIMTVLYRPFPFEAGNLQAIIASFEGMLLLGLTLHRRREVWRALRSVRTSPMLAIALVYGGVFVYAYTGFSNFGLLARQRVQVYPFLMMLLCMTLPLRGLTRGGVRRGVPEHEVEPPNASARSRQGPTSSAEVT